MRHLQNPGKSYMYRISGLRSESRPNRAIHVLKVSLASYDVSGLETSTILPLSSLITVSQAASSVGL